MAEVILSSAIAANLQRLIDKLNKEIAGRAYDMIVQVYSANEYIAVAHGCFAFMFTNVGDTPATVKGMIIFPSATPATALGDSRSIAAHKLDIYKGTMDLSFRAPFGVAPAVEIVQLYYVD
jgi:hypothetical protein